MIPDVRRLERTGPSLRVRIAAWVAGATAVLSVLAIVAAFVAVRSAMQADLRDALRRDARAVAAAYDGEEAADRSDATARPGPTGRVRVQLYGPDGNLFAASDRSLESDAARLPSSVVAEAPADYRGELNGTVHQVATAPFRYGTVAVLADTAYIGSALRGVARALAIAAAILLIVSAAIGWLAARAATTPIRRLSAAASRLGPEDLEPLALPMPDDEVGRLARVLDELLERVRDARDGQRRFLAETSHELRTPLTSLRGFLRRAQRSAGEKTARDLADADRIAAGMARLVEDLLALSRGRLVREIAPHLVDVGPEVARPVAGEFEGVRVVGAGEALVLGEPERLRQALRNLVANAVRAAGPDGSVEVRWEGDDREVRLLVRDDGPGLAPEVREHLFEPFRSGPGGGTGLGLAIAMQLVRAHGGRLEVASRPGATTFTIALTRIDDAVG